MDWKIDLGIFKKKKRVVLEGLYDLDYVELDMGKMRVLDPVKVKIVVVRAREGVAVGGYVKTAIEHPCTRCLTPVRVEINGTVEALYVPESERGSPERETRLENLKNVIYYTNPVVDLGERILEAIVMDVPQQVLCRPDCKGLCPYCGINLNEHPDHVCEKSGVGFDTRFALLAKLKEDLGEG